MNLNSHKLKLALLLSVILLSGLLLTQYHPPIHELCSSSSSHQLLTTPAPLSQALESPHWNTSNHYKQRFPQAIIIGVRKAGTRALLNMLNLHPNIVAAKPEIHFFDRDVHFNQSVQWYIDAMPYTNRNQLTIEKTPAYFVGEEVPQRLHSVLPHVKLLLIVRNPIDRIVSDFTQLNTKKRQATASRPVTFEDAVFLDDTMTVNTKYFPVWVSMYHTHLERWLQYFPLKQIHIVDGDAFIKNPASELKKAEQFLNVSSYFTRDMFVYNVTKGFYCWRQGHSDGPQKCLGSAKGREHPDISIKALNALKQFFKQHNEEFYKLTKQRFTW